MIIYEEQHHDDNELRENEEKETIPGDNY